MKKLFSILTVLLVVTAMLHLSVARHYCGGELVASRISLTGGLATCGMENTEGSHPFNNDSDHFGTHCCDDVLTFYSITNNYTTTANAAAEFLTAKIPVPDLQPESLVRFSVISIQNWPDISPPGFLMTTSVDLSAIRVLRI
ncbi:MAG: hypothetical protein WAW07_09485 [Bacteroidales bacterium]